MAKNAIRNVMAFHKLEQTAFKAARAIKSKHRPEQLSITVDFFVPPLYPGRNETRVVAQMEI